MISQIRMICLYFQACQVETDPSLVSAYIVFLSHYAMNQQLQTLSELAVVSLSKSKDHILRT